MSGYSKHYHAIVVGVGAMGSATCYQLARRNKRVLGIERFDIPNDLGSSHGYTRIIRLAYSEHPSYVSLLQRSYQLWADIERVSGEQLLYRVGCVDSGPADSWVFRGSLQSCIEYDLPHEVLTSRELSERFPGYRLPQENLAVFQPDGGFLLPERGTVAYVEAAHALGAEVHGREALLDWEPWGDAVRVFTDRDEYTADALVFTAGGWNQNVLPFLRGLAVPERQVLAWLQPTRPELFRPERFPVFNCLVPEGRYYGFPVFAVPGLKIGRYHHFEEAGEAEYLSREAFREDEAVLRDFAARYFPDGAGPTMILKACLFTNTPDRHFLIDLHPDHPQVSFAAGFSGHGYKFASVIGEIMADLVERRATRHDISLFNLARFTGQISNLHQQKIDMFARGAWTPPTHGPAHPLYRGGSGDVPGGALGRPLDNRRRTTDHSRHPAGYGIPSDRGQWSVVRRPSDDPRYWTEQDIKPFW